MNLVILNRWLTAAMSLAVIAGVAVAIVSAIVATKTLKETQKTASATVVLKLRETLDELQYKNISDEIQNNRSPHALLKDRGGRFNDLDIERYIGNFEDLGYLVRENVVDGEMVYHHFSYEIEKAWCNDDVKDIVTKEQKADKSITATSDPFYGNFEKLALSFLNKERQSCGNLDKE